MDARDRAFWMTFREALLLILDGLERRLDLQPRTSELRKLLRAQTIGDKMYSLDSIAPESTNLA